MKQWSYSRLQTYAQCPMQFRLRYVDHEEGTTSAAATRGTLVHEFAENYARHCFATKTDTDWDAGRRMLASYPPEVRAICERFVESTSWDWSLTVADGNGVEREFEAPLPGGRGLLRGRCDLVLYNEFEDSLIVTDYKSGWSPREKPEECPPQLQCYAWAMQQAFTGVESVRAIYRYLGNGISYAWDVWEPSPDWAVSLIDRIASDDEYRATPGDACEWCDYTHVCPLATADPLTAPTSDEQAQEALRQVLALEARLKRLRGAVNKWSGAHGPVRIAGFEAGKDVPACVEEVAPGEFVYTDRLATDLSIAEVRAKLTAAGAKEEDLTRLVIAPSLDGQFARKWLDELLLEEDPFGAGETDAVADALRECFAPAPWSGSLRFDVRKTKTEGEEAA